MTALPQHMYGDPLNNILRAEQSSCKGCKHITEWMVFGQKMQGCNKGRKRRNAKCYEETAGKIYCQGGK